MSGGDTRLCFVGVAECGDQVKQVPSPSIVQTSNIASMSGGDTRLCFVSEDKGGCQHCARVIVGVV